MAEFDAGKFVAGVADPLIHAEELLTNYTNRTKIRRMRSNSFPLGPIPRSLLRLGWVIGFECGLHECRMSGWWSC